LFVAASACTSSSQSFQGKPDVGVEVGAVDSGTGRETAAAGPEVANDGVADRPAIDREIPDSQPVPETAAAGPEVANDGAVDRTGADGELPDSQSAPASPDAAPEQAACYAWPSDEASCVKSTCVAAICDFFPVTMSMSAAQGGPLLAKLQVTTGPCVASPACPLGCQTMSVSPRISVVPDGGTTCDFLALSTDGRSETFSVAIVQNYDGPSGMCCAVSSGRGYWVVLSPSVHFDPSSVVVDFNRDGGLADGSDVGDSEMPGAD